MDENRWLREIVYVAKLKFLFLILKTPILYWLFAQKSLDQLTKEVFRNPKGILPRIRHEIYAARARPRYLIQLIELLKFIPEEILITAEWIKTMFPSEVFPHSNLQDRVRQLHRILILFFPSGGLYGYRQTELPKDFFEFETTPLKMGLRMDQLQNQHFQVFTQWMTKNSKVDSRKLSSDWQNESIKLFHLLEAQSSQGDSVAQYLLAGCYSEGSGVAQDLKMSVIWMCKSAELGNCDAQCTLGYMYFLGYNVEKNVDLSVKWLKLAAIGKHNLAKQALAVVKAAT